MVNENFPRLLTDRSLCNDLVIIPKNGLCFMQALINNVCEQINVFFIVRFFHFSGCENWLKKVES